MLNSNLKLKYFFIAVFLIQLLGMNWNGKIELSFLNLDLTKNGIFEGLSFFGSFSLGAFPWDFSDNLINSTFPLFEYITISCALGLNLWVLSKVSPKQSFGFVVSYLVITIISALFVIWPRTNIFLIFGNWFSDSMAIRDTIVAIFYFIQIIFYTSWIFIAFRKAKNKPAKTRA